MPPKPKQTSRTPYSLDPVWTDVIPIPQNDGGPDALASIAYTDEYSEAMSYLRAIMAADEHSERGLALTGHLVGLNPSHYTVWLFRAATLFALDKDLKEEIAWLNGVALRHLKNYQIWHHRQLLIDKLSSPAGETDFLAAMFAEDSKNYHVWSYRQWLVRRFSLWNSPAALAQELSDIERLLEEDVQNNSAWNHRYFVVFGRDSTTTTNVGEEVLERELTFAEDKIALAPQNQSPWNYVRGVVKRASRPLGSVRALAEKYAPLPTDAGAEKREIRSSHALDVLADIYAEEKDAERAAKALELLATEYDPIRANYWQYRKRLLVKGQA